MPGGGVMTEVRFDLSQFDRQLADYINQNAEVIAKRVAATARASRAFKDKTGRLRKSIRAKKSRFADGGWIVTAGGKGAAHAHLVEYGHGGKKPAAKKPFLRPALAAAIDEARAQFGATR
jgi:hypothetical protein